MRFCIKVALKTVLLFMLTGCVTVYKYSIIPSKPIKTNDYIIGIAKTIPTGESLITAINGNVRDGFIAKDGIIIKYPSPWPEFTLPAGTKCGIVYKYEDGPLICRSDMTYVAQANFGIFMPGNRYDLKVCLLLDNKDKLYGISAEEIGDLLAACDSNVISITGKVIEQRQAHLKPIIIFGIATGCRKSEILTLKWDEVDMVHGFVNLSDTKNGDGRQIAINDALMTVLKSLPREKGVPYVFFDPETKKRFGDVKTSFNTARNKAGLDKKVIFHTLRHTFASHLVMNGTDLTTVSKLLGHKSLTMTLRYSHLAPNHLEKAVNSLNSVFDTKKHTENENSILLAYPMKKALRIAA